jgi:hypothetical protein
MVAETFPTSSRAKAMNDIQARNAEYMAAAKARAEAAKAERMAPVLEVTNRIAERRAELVRADSLAIIETRERAQTVLNEIGDVAPTPVIGERLETYQRRVLEVLAPNTMYANANRASIPADVLPRVIESACDDVYENRMHPADLKAGEYRYIVKEDSVGRQVEEIRTGAGTGPGASVFRQLYGALMDKPLIQDTSNLKQQVIL